MNKIDQDPLDTLETLLKEATQGSVYVSYDEDGFPVIHLDENDENEDSYDPIARFSAGVPNDRHDAALYAHLRNLAPALLEVVKAARAFQSTFLDFTDTDGPLSVVERACDELTAALRALKVTK